MVELGRVDICTEVSMILSCLAMPPTGHLDAVFHAFVYVKKNHNVETVFDPTETEVNMEDFPREAERRASSREIIC